MLTKSDALWLLAGLAVLLVFADNSSHLEPPSIPSTMTKVAPEVRTELYKGLCVNNEGFKETSKIDGATVIECNDGSKYVDVTGEQDEDN